MKKLTSVVVAICASIACFAQKSADWKKEFPSRINWYKVSDAGVFMVATKDGLYGLDADGKEVWKADDAENIKSTNVDAIDGTPYISLARQQFIKSSNQVIDVVSGKTIVNTNNIGFQGVLKRLYLPQSNSVLFYGSSKDGKLMLTRYSFTDEKVLWEQKKLFEKQSEMICSKAYEMADGIMLATTKNVYKLNKNDGSVIWSADMKSDMPVAKEEIEEGVEENKKESTLGKLGKLGGKLGVGPVKNANTAATNNPFSGKNANAFMTATSADFFEVKGQPGKVYFWNQDYLAAFDLATGKEVFEKYKLVSPIGYLLQDKRGLIIATKEKREEDAAKAGNKGLMGRISAGKDRATLILVDPVTGKEAWNSDVNLKGDILAYRNVGNKLILGTQQDDGDNYISIVDLEAGKSLTKKPMVIKGAIQDLQLMPQGLYYRTTDQINILDLETAEKTWKKGFNVPGCLGYNEDANTGYVSAKGIIYKVDFAKGDMTEWKTDLGFKQGEAPSTIQLLGDNIFISSNQNAALYDKSGKEIYKTYVPAPGRTMAGKILSGMGGVASMAVGMAATAQYAQLSYAKGYYGSTDPQLNADIQSAGNLAVAGFSSGIASFQSINKRFNATKQAQNSIAMLTNFGNSNQGKDAGVTIVDKSSGKRIADFLFGDKTDPAYLIDDLGRIIYYQTGGNSFEGFKY